MIDACETVAINLATSYLRFKSKEYY